jgi:RNA polymerase sigma factor (TIGR02999 family)
MADSPDGPDQGEVPRMLDELCGGDRSAADRLLPVVYDDLRKRARRYLRASPGNTLQPTVLVHEAYLRLVGHTPDAWRGRTHFFAVAAVAMRQVLIDHARHNRRAKRGGALRRVTLADAVAPDAGPDVGLLALEQALERLAALDERQARIVELRALAGLTAEEVAEVLGLSRRTVQSDWAFARAWLRAELSKGAEHER